MDLGRALYLITRVFTRAEWDEFLAEPRNKWFHDLPEDVRAPLRRVYARAEQ